MNQGYFQNDGRPCQITEVKMGLSNSIPIGSLESILQKKDRLRSNANKDELQDVTIVEWRAHPFLLPMCWANKDKAWPGIKT